MDCSKFFSSRIYPEEADLEIIAANVKLEKRDQERKDLNRIKNKTFREYARIENALTAYNKELIKLLKKNNLAKCTISHTEENLEAVGLVHITDTHFNELVELTYNKYDFTVASKRLKKLAMRAKSYFSIYKIKKIAVLMTGDLMNSDRRLDELLNQATNRSKATFLAVQLLQQFILDLNSDFNVVVSGITGNESRVKEEIHWTDIVATDNYDWTILNMLKWIFKDSKGIEFKDPLSYNEDVINIGGKHILMLHGNQKPYGPNPLNGITKSIRKYSGKGIKIDFVIFGHLHESLISDTYARGGSLVGANAYSEDYLQLVSKASQNLHVVGENMIDSLKVDLQNIDDIKGYNITNELIAYNTKSATKSSKGVTIFKIKI